MMKGAVELTGKPVRMESRNPFAQASSLMGIVDFVDPELGLHLVHNVDKSVCIHDSGHFSISRALGKYRRANAVVFFRLSVQTLS